jgi:hypothetical protein
MIYSLKRVKEQMLPEIEKYKLIVSPEDHAVGWAHGITQLSPYTTGRKCRQVINHYIKLAKAEEQRKANENQATLL